MKTRRTSKIALISTFLLTLLAAEYFFSFRSGILGQLSPGNGDAEYYYFNSTSKMRISVGEQQTTVQVARSNAISVTAAAAADNHTNSAKEDECIRLRGTSGYWYRDEKLAQQTFYAHGFRSNKWARQNDILTGVYPGNSYNWRDTSLSGNTMMSMVAWNNGNKNTHDSAKSDPSILICSARQCNNFRYTAYYSWVTP